MITDTVMELKDGAQVKDLRKAFVEQQRITNVSPAAVQVRETQGGEIIKSSTMLTDYFVPAGRGLAAAPGPGRSEDTALFLTVPQQLQGGGGGGDIVAEMQALRLEVHGVRETLPSVLVGHVLTPSQASRLPQVVSSVFDSLGLTLTPERNEVTYKLPEECGDEWKFNWKWPKNASGDDRGLERQSYAPVKDYLGKLGLFCVDVSEGQFCVDKLLFNEDIYTRRNQNPMLVRGQNVYLRHRIQGRTDLAVLRQDNKEGYILRNMVKFVVELKTVYGYQQSQTGCMRECQLQLIGLNAFNTNCSPPVVLSNLARKHQVIYLDADEEWRYTIKVQDCDSFAAAIQFADVLSNRDCISEHFSRPASPEALH